jgi:hypothetical protein
LIYHILTALPVLTAFSIKCSVSGCGCGSIYSFNAVLALRGNTSFHAQHLDVFRLLCCIAQPPLQGKNIHILSITFKNPLQRIENAVGCDDTLSTLHIDLGIMPPQQSLSLISFTRTLTHICHIYQLYLQICYCNMQCGSHSGVFSICSARVE